jgi:hypothetical protein
MLNLLMHYVHMQVHGATDQVTTLSQQNQTLPGLSTEGHIPLSVGQAEVHGTIVAPTLQVGGGTRERPIPLPVDCHLDARISDNGNHKIWPNEYFHLAQLLEQYDSFVPSLCLIALKDGKNIESIFYQIIHNKLHTHKC